jgi:multiple sugar transport system substrate-binding protein
MTARTARGARSRGRVVRWAGTAAAFGALAGTAAGCGSGAGGSRPAGTFTYWTSGWQPAQIAEVDAAFARTHPGLHARGEFIAGSDEYLPRVVSALKSGTQPTVLLDQNPSDLPELAQSGKLVNLDGALAAETRSLYPGIRGALFYRGHQLGMALAGTGEIALFYNKKAFAAAGISRPPATWTELAADARRLSDPARGTYGFYVPQGDAEWISFAWQPLLYSEGGSFLDPAGRATAFDGPAGVKALTIWANLLRDRAAPTTSYAEAGSFDGAPAFASGTVAMIADGQWALPTFRSAGIDFGVAPLPRGDAGSVTSIGIGVGALLKTSTAEDQAGLEFLRFLATPAEGAYLATTNGGLPSDPAQAREPALRDLARRTPGYQVFAAALSTGKARPINPSYNAISQALWTGINAALKGRRTPEQALREAAEEGNSALRNDG